MPPQGNFGLIVADAAMPADAANHLDVVVQTASVEGNYPRTDDYNQVYDPPNGVRMYRRMAAKYYLWWEEPGGIVANPPNPRQ
jgi:hypothetical protein